MLTQFHVRCTSWSDTWARLEDERVMLQRIAAGQPLAEVLDYVLRTVEAQSSVPLWTSILLVDDEGRLQVGAAPRLPADYLSAIEGSLVGPHAASWGKAAYSGEAVYEAGIAELSDWIGWRGPIVALGLQTCWSSPIKGTDGRLLGVFSNYYNQRCMPSSHDVEAIALVTRTVALTIERHCAMQALRESARRWRSMFEGMQEGFFMAEAVRGEDGVGHDFLLLEANPAFDLQCGRPRGTSAGHRLREVLRHAPARLMDVFVGVLETGTSAQSEYYVEEPRPAWYELHVRREGAERVMAMQLDVSARKQAEAKLQEEQRHKNFQLTLGDQLRRLELPSQIERLVCGALGRHFGLSEVLLLHVSLEGGAMRVVAGWAARGEPALPARALRASMRKTVRSERICSFSPPAGMKDSCLVVPLGRWGRPGDALVLSSSIPVWLQPTDRACIEELAARLCDATERAAHPLQLQERVEQAVAELKARTAALNEAETALHHAQRLEVVGRLTAGIAHDFNNVLQGIAAALYLVERHLARGDAAAVVRYVGMASDACSRAGQLTQRLLTFSRKQPVDPQVFDVKKTLRSMLDLFRRYTGERIALSLELEPDLWRVCCDVSQFENVMLNLIINACDAMPGGGHITLRASNAVLDSVRLRRFPQAISGNFVEIMVADTGCGMKPEVLERTFEPFFTTKPVGAGTGLGLSTSYRFVQQAGGAAGIESAPEEGTVVRIWLPQHRGDVPAGLEPAAPEPEVREILSQAVVLLVEDDDSLREMMAEAVAGLSVTVLWAADGFRGIEVMEEAARVDLLVADVGLPGMDGRALAVRARERRPGLPVLFITGYAENATQEPFLSGPRTELIVKPFSLDVLASCVREMLSVKEDDASLAQG